MKAIFSLFLFLVTLSAYATEQLGFDEALNRFNGLFTVKNQTTGAIEPVIVGSEDKYNQNIQWGKFEKQKPNEATLTVIRTDNRFNEKKEPVLTSFGQPIPMVMLLPSRLTADEQGTNARLVLHPGKPEESSYAVYALGENGIELREITASMGISDYRPENGPMLWTGGFRFSRNKEGILSYEYHQDSYTVSKAFADSHLVKDKAGNSVHDVNGRIAYRSVPTEKIKELLATGELQKAPDQEDFPQHAGAVWKQVWPR